MEVALKVIMSPCINNLRYLFSTCPFFFGCFMPSCLVPVYRANPLWGLLNPNLLYLVKFEWRIISRKFWQGKKVECNKGRLKQTGGGSQYMWVMSHSSHLVDLSWGWLMLTTAPCNTCITTRLSLVKLGTVRNVTRKFRTALQQVGLLGMAFPRCS